jgi:hypothetical protein
VAREAAARAVIPEKTDLTGLSWWLVAALFLTERGLSHWWSRRHATEGGA